MSGPESRPRDVVTLEQEFDYSWWASDGPTAGYLSMTAIRVAWLLPGLEALPPRRVDLHVLAAPSAGPVRLEIDLLAGPTGIRLLIVTFVQSHPVVHASVYFSDDIPADDRPPQGIPAALPPECYAEMEFPGAAPPVTTRFSYRPIGSSEAGGRGPGSDLVWVKARNPLVQGAAAVAGVIDCWYPTVHTLQVARFLALEVASVEQPVRTSLLGASLLFPAAANAYSAGGSVLLASRLQALNEGHHYELCDIWSERGELLVSGHILRSDHRSRAEH